jgi:hypothetical protein
LTEFVEKNASTANTIFGKLVGAKPDDDNKNKFRPRISNKGTLGVIDIQKPKPVRHKHQAILKRPVIEITILILQGSKSDAYIAIKLIMIW